MIETEDPQEKIRHNIAVYQAAIKAGTHTQKDLDDYLSEVHEQRTGKPFVNPAPDTSETNGDRALGALGHAYQGLTMGQGDKVIAALQSLGKVSTGQVHNVSGLRDDFNANRADTRKVLDDYQARRPAAAGVMELAGSLPTLMVGGGGLANVGGRVLEAMPARAVRVARQAVMEIPGARKVERIIEAGRRLEPSSHAEGFVGNGMDNVIEAVKARGTPSPNVVKALREQPLYDAFSNEAQAVDQATGHQLPDVVQATERYRTGSGALQQRAPNARFEWFAEQMAKRKP